MGSLWGSRDTGIPCLPQQRRQDTALGMCEVGYSLPEAFTQGILGGWGD